MSDTNQNQNDAAFSENNAEGGFPYVGDAIPVALRWIWTIFGVWAVSYLIAYMMPDLLVWLK